VSFPAASGEIVNDIEGLAPKSITFGAEIGDIVISGNPISDIWAVTNLSTTANVTFTSPVAYADGKIIEVFHAGRYNNAQYNNANGAFVHETGLVVFAGGVTGHEVRSYDSLGNAAKTGSHNIYAGHYTRTNSTLYVNANGYNNETEYGYRPAIYHNSSLTVKNAGQTQHLYIGEGGAFTTGVAHVSAKGHRLCCTVLGEYVVTSCVTNSGTGDKYAFYQRPAGKPPVFKIEKIYTTATENWLYLGSSNAASDSTFYIGSGGFVWSSASAKGAICLGDDHSGTATTLRPWYSDFTICARGDSTKSLVVRRKAIFCTDDEQGVPRTITLDGKICFVNTDEQIVSGHGTFRVNSTPDSSSVAAPVRVIDSATLAFGPGASLGTGSVTIEKGGMLKAAESGEGTLAGTVGFSMGSRLGFNFTSIDASPVLTFAAKPDIAGKTVFVSVTAENGISPRKFDGRWLLVGGGQLDGCSPEDFILEECPSWVDARSPFGIEDGNLYLNVKKTGFSLSVR
jgi:hypothetical protein